MGAGRIYWGQITTVILALIASAMGATQWTAARLDYQSALGAPDLMLFHVPVYAPWRAVLWWRQYDVYARPVFETGAIVFACGVAASGSLAFLFSLWRAREARRADTYGSARWARRCDLKAQGLLKGDGVVLGSWNRDLLRHDGDEHVLVVAPTSTGKSVGIALPTGLVWRESYLTLDLKGENWRLTSGLRRSFGPVFRFDPTSGTTHRYNPLTQIRRGENEVRDAQALADMLVDPEGGLRERSHWQLRAFELLVAAMLWTLYVEERKTLSGLGDLLSDPDRPVLVLFEDMLTRPIKDGAPHPVVAAGARQLLDMAEAERSGVVSTALGFLTLYRDPVLARATETSDFSIDDLVSGPSPVSLYLVIPPEDMSRLKALLRLILNQLLKRLTEIAARMDGKGRRVLLLLDEFPQLGRLDFFEYALAYIRGYRIKACLIAQSLNQIAQAYGERSSILENAHIRVAFACNDDRTAMRISDMLGATTETRAQMNYAGSRMAPWLNHTTVSRQEVPRPLLTPGEVMQLPADDALILPGGAPPIRARKIRYFDEPFLLARVKAPFTSPRPSPSGLATDWSSPASTPGSDPSPPASSHGEAAPRPTPSPRRRGSASSGQYAFDFSTHDHTSKPACERVVIEDDLGAGLDAPFEASGALLPDPAPDLKIPGRSP
ncbi:MAG: IncP-type conjugal transfer protein TraG [Alphaproteobacteria bacterium]|nr:IncP-type conjugal transfer protein TraG [Alphaproteobacteria bacterium]